MPITVQDIKEHHDQFGLHDMSAMPTADFRQAVDAGGMFWLDHHEHVRSALSGEIFATNVEQLDVIIQHLQEYRTKMTTPPEWMREK